MFFCTVTRMYSVLELVKWLVRISCWELYSPVYLINRQESKTPNMALSLTGLQLEIS